MERIYETYLIYNKSIIYESGLAVWQSRIVVYCSSFR